MERKGKGESKALNDGNVECRGGEVLKSMSIFGGIAWPFPSRNWKSIRRGGEGGPTLARSATAGGRHQRPSLSPRFDFSVALFHSVSCSVFSVRSLGTLPVPSRIPHLSFSLSLFL